MPLEDHYTGDAAFNRWARSPDPALDEEFEKWDGKEKNGEEKKADPEDTRGPL